MFRLIFLVLFTLLSPAWAQSPRPRVVVVGGGLAGLITSWRLEQKGYTVCLLEGSDRLGGRVGTAHYPNGLTAEYGMQELWEKSPLLGIVQELGLKLESS
jgi:monoamine oxidase